MATSGGDTRPSSGPTSTPPDPSQVVP